MKRYVFGYGSLMNPLSIAATLTRTLSTQDLIPAELKGYQRDWSLREWVTLEGGQDRAILFLNIRPQADAVCNGILFPVTGDDLPALDRRERNYTRVQVGEQTTPHVDGEVFAYVGRTECLHAGEPCVVMAKYVGLVEAGLAAWDKTFVETYRRTTPPHGRALVDGAYRLSRRDPC